MKRILVGSIHHESNSFNPIIADEKDFVIKYGGESLILENKNDSLRGIVDTLKNKNYEIIPTLSARAVPNGEVSLKLYNHIKKEFIERAIKANEEKKLDGINLALHGSMRVVGLGEAEGDLLEELRKYFKEIPIVVALDMHTTMTDKMHKYADAYVGYKCAPHTDCFETGEHSANMLIDILENKISLKKSWVRIPMLIAGEQSETSTEPMVSFINRCKKLETQEGISAVSILMGYPWADSKEASVGVYVMAKTQEKSDKVALELARDFFDERENFKFHTETYLPQKSWEAVLEGLKEEKFPIYLSDSGDNPTAGSSSDCTELLKIMVEDKRTLEISNPVIYGGIYDPISTAKCKNKVGEMIELSVGGLFDKITTKPLKIEGKVIKFVEKYGRYKGDIAVVRCNNVDILITEKHIGYVTPTLYEDLGLSPKSREIIVCKLGYLTAPHKALAKRTIMALTKGSTNENLLSIDYKKVIRPIFPLDKEFEYSPKDNLK